MATSSEPLSSNCVHPPEAVKGEAVENGLGSKMSEKLKTEKKDNSETEPHINSEAQSEPDHTLENGEDSGLEKSRESSDLEKTEKQQDLVKENTKSLEGQAGNSTRGSGVVVPTVIVNHKSPSSAQKKFKGHARDSSVSSVQSGLGSPSSADPGSMSSSSIGSHDLPFTSREALLEHVRAEFCSSASASNSSLRENGGEGQSELITQLLEHIVTLKMELETLKEANKQLHSQRSTMDDELHTLTENLFEEAYKMVDEAKGHKVVAEKRLADAAGKIDAMETEMGVLKTLLHTSDTSAVQQHHKNTLHPSPQIHKHHRKPSIKKALKKIKKVTSSGSSKTPSKVKTMATPIALVEHKGDLKGDTLEVGETLPSDYSQFSDWLEKLSTSREHPFLEQVVELDVKPCLSFRNQSLSSEVQKAVSENNLQMEPLSNGTEETGECALSGDSSPCSHKLQLGGTGQCYYISQQCRDRIAAVCDFYMFISHVEKGIMKMETTKLYWQVARLRALMTISRLSLHLPDSH